METMPSFVPTTATRSPPIRSVRCRRAGGTWKKEGEHLIGLFAGFALAEAAADFLEHELDPLVDKLLDWCSASDASDKGLIARGAKLMRAAVERTIERYGAIATELERFVRGKYTELVHALMSEIRLFSGINTALFAAVLALLIARWREPGVVLVPADLLLIATAVCIAVYIFGQNWFFSIFLQDYAGYGYLAYVGVVFAFLVDIAFNRARMTQAALNISAAPLAS